MISVQTSAIVRADLPSREFLKLAEGAGTIEITLSHINGEQSSLDIELGDFKQFVEALQTMAGSVSCEA